MPRIKIGAGIILDWEPNKFNLAASRAFDRVIEELNDKFKEIISRVGAFPEFPDRDIIDTGFLFENQEIVRKGTVEAEYRWGAYYAIYVHEGYTLRNGRQQPGRPWTELGIKEYQPEVKFEQYFREELKRLGIVGRIPAIRNPFR